MSPSGGDYIDPIKRGVRCFVLLLYKFTRLVFNIHVRNGFSPVYFIHAVSFAGIHRYLISARIGSTE